jgi:tripartite-type tricarboxylate transporter receptor subunit TctC
MHHLLRLLVAAGLTLFVVTANAQTFPSKPITIIVPFGPGSATDTITRVVAQQLGNALKQSVVVETRPGANGAIAAMHVARAAPDGYTLFMSTNSPHSAAPFLMKNLGYDPAKDFTAVTRMGSYTLMLVTHPSIPAKTIKELIAHARPIRRSCRSPAATPRAWWPARPSRPGPSSTFCTCPTRVRRRQSRTCWAAGCR